MNTAEAKILDDMMAALMRLQPDIMYWRNNTGAFKADDRFVRFGQPGSPDILGCYKGVAIGIECKSTIGKQSGSQKMWQSRWERAGGLYFMARNQETIEAVINSLTRKGV